MAGYIHDRPTFFFFLPMDAQPVPPPAGGTPGCVGDPPRRRRDLLGRPPFLPSASSASSSSSKAPFFYRRQGHRAVIFAGRVPDLHVVELVDQSLLQVPRVERQISCCWPHVVISNLGRQEVLFVTSNSKTI